jgi:predicted nucleotidyltransferase
MPRRLVARAPYGRSLTSLTVTLRPVILPVQEVHHMQNIGMSQELIAAFCYRHHIRKLALFGSVLRADFRPDSDVDVLVEFEPGHTPGFLRLATMELELSQILAGRKADVRMPEDLSRYFRSDVLASAETIYAQG